MTIKMDIDTEKLKNDCGLIYCGSDNLIFYIKYLLYYLNTHNKNYTKEQECKINLLTDIIKCMEGLNDE